MEEIHELLGYERIKIIQRDDMLRFSLDSMLLADFVECKNCKNIIDLGTGNAPIPLFLTLKTNAKIVGVDIQEDVCDVAKRSVSLNNLENQIDIVNNNIKDIYKVVGNNKFDNIGFGLVQNKTPEFKSDQDISTYLQNLFTIDNLNKDIYLRKNLSDDGKINIFDLEKYYGFKNNKVNKEKICELVPTTTNLELVEEKDKKFISVKDYKTMSQSLKSIDELRQQRIALQNQTQQMMLYNQMQMGMFDFGGYGMPMNYGNIPANYYFPNQQPMYPMQGYPPMYQQPYQQPGP